MTTSQIIIEHFHSLALEGNPLDDPTTRRVPVYLPPGYNEGNQYPTVYFLASFADRGQDLLNTGIWKESIQERMDRLIKEGTIQPMLIVMPDASTRYGGSQYLNSSATGNYRNHILELVTYIDNKYPTTDHRAVMGHSSGGYGALMLGMQHPDIFGLVANHAGDSFFELNYKPDFPDFIRTYEKLGESGIQDLLANPKAGLAKGVSFFTLATAAMAACYSPNPSAPLGFDLPFDLYTGELIPEIWQKWLGHDPVYLVDKYADALRSLNLLFLDCGIYDEHNLLYGARIISRKLNELDIPHTFEEFEGGHRHTKYRYDVSLKTISDKIG